MTRPLSLPARGRVDEIAVCGGSSLILSLRPDRAEVVHFRLAGTGAAPRAGSPRGATRPIDQARTMVGDRCTAVVWRWPTGSWIAAIAEPDTEVGAWTKRALQLPRTPWPSGPSILRTGVSHRPVQETSTTCAAPPAESAGSMWDEELHHPGGGRRLTGGALIGPGHDFLALPARSHLRGPSTCGAQRRG